VATRRTTMRTAKPILNMSPGEMLRTVRELQALSQGELAKASGIPQSAISALESGRLTLGVDRAERLARALSVHPAVLVWPHWENTAKAG
jgi:transcriptional regulator with XRE-family HTH domain